MLSFTPFPPTSFQQQLRDNISHHPYKNIIEMIEMKNHCLKKSLSDVTVQLNGSCELVSFPFSLIFFKARESKSHASNRGENTREAPRRSRMPVG